MKHLGALSLFPLLDVLGLRLMLVPDDAQLAKMQARSDWQSPTYPRCRPPQKSALAAQP
jgi:hypothetical protein